MKNTKQPRKKSQGKTIANEKEPFDIERAISLLREAVRPYPKAALFELAGEGYQSVFEQLVACIISVRTRDEVTLPVSRRLFAQARTPAQLAALSEKEIDTLISDCTFHEPKSRTLRDLAQRTVKEFAGELPCDPETLQSFRGVGPKCSNLAIGIACGRALIGVDVHVHRVTNRWGYVETRTPEKTMEALQQSLPQEYWIEINALLVPFGKHICTRVRPHCSTCPLLAMCQQIGVTTHR